MSRSFDDYKKNMFSKKAEEESHRTRLLLEFDGIRNLLIGSTIHLEDGRNIKVEEKDLQNIIFTEDKTITWDVVQDVPHYIVGITYDINRISYVQTFNIPDEELGCHHNEICSNCGVDVYRNMKYCYECGSELVWNHKEEIKFEYMKIQKRQPGESLEDFKKRIYKHSAEQVSEALGKCMSSVGVKLTGLKPVKKRGK